MFSEYPQEAALDTPKQKSQAESPQEAGLDPPKQKALPRLAAHGPETSASVGSNMLPVDFLSGRAFHL